MLALVSAALKALRGDRSVIYDGTRVELSGDSATPGNDKFYGTNGSGTRGWYARLATAFASSSQAKAATSTTTVLNPDNLIDYLTPQTLTDASTIAFDASLGINFTVTLGGNRTLGNPTNLQAGQSGLGRIVQDGTGSRTLAYASNWKFAGGTAPVLSTAASSVDLLSFYYDGTTLHANLLNTMS